MTTANMIGYLEGEFQYDNNVYIEESTVSVTMAPLMKANEGDNSHLSLQLTVVYAIDDKVLMKYGGVVTYRVGDWEKARENEKAFTALKQDLWGQTIPFFRGIICEKLRGTAIERMFLPMLPTDKIAEIPFQVG